uniref:BTB domain-containing protein n=1 Tax=Panagrolaimus sp. ES5 TaxID=591445 RepID=A0AC34G959_9BILA
MSSSIPSICEKPIAFRWKIAYDQFLNASEDQYWCLESETINVEHYGMENYFLRLSPSEEDENLITLELVIEKQAEPKIKKNFKFSILSVKNSWQSIQKMVNSVKNTFLAKICTYEELIDPKNNYFVNGNLVILMEAILTYKDYGYVYESYKSKKDASFCLSNDFDPFGRSFGCLYDKDVKVQMKKEKKVIEKKPISRNLGLQLWNRNGKDFTFVAGGKEIRVHKFIIIDCHVFERMIESGLKESKENKVIITDFSFETVEIALQYFYGIEISELLTVNNGFNLIRFADKYDITDLKVS